MVPLGCALPIGTARMLPQRIAVRVRFCAVIIYKHRPMRPRRGFSLIELLVVIGIISVLAGLLLPAIQAAREVGRRAQCQNNLKQMGLAVHNYHDIHQVFPRGGWLPTNFNRSWAATLLPQLEQQALYDSINRSVPYTDASNVTAGGTILQVFLCPTSPKQDLLKPSPDLPSSSSNRYARSDYGAVNGERGLRFASATNSPERGVLILEKNISLAAVTDGTSQTILISEAPEGMHSLWFSVKNLFDQSAAINASATYSPQYVFFDYGQEISSYHTGGAYALFADGSIHFLTEELDVKTLAALCSRSGKELIGDF